MSKFIQKQMLIIILALGSVSFSQAEGLSYESACQSQGVYKHWNPGRVRYLKESDYFPNTPSVSLDYTTKKFQNYAVTFQNLKYELPIPKKVTDGQIILAKANELRSKILILQKKSLTKTQTIYNSLYSCLVQRSDCKTAEEYTNNFNQRIKQANTYSQPAPDKNSLQVDDIKMDEFSLLLEERISVQKNIIKNQSDSQLFVYDQYLEEIYNTDGLSKDAYQRELFCAIKIEMSFNTTEKERILILANFYVDAAIILGAGFTGTYVSLTLLRAVKFLHKFVPLILF